MNELQLCINNLRYIALQLQDYQRAQEASPSFCMPSAARLARIGDDLYRQIDTLIALLKLD